MGTNSGTTPIRVQGFAERIELVPMLQAGLVPLRAISADTKNGARLLGVVDRCGTLEPGKKAKRHCPALDSSLSHLETVVFAKREQPTIKPTKPSTGANYQ